MEIMNRIVEFIFNLLQNDSFIWSRYKYSEHILCVEENSFIKLKINLLIFLIHLYRPLQKTMEVKQVQPLMANDHSDAVHSVK